jgi:putative acetyltransferase
MHWENTHHACRVELETFDFNKPAQKCYLKVGFKEVGRRGKARFIEGKYCDCIMMDMLRDKWIAESNKQ